MKKRVVIITNVPSPYRVDFFYYLQTQIEKYDFYVIYSSASMASRQWHADEERILNATYLKSINIRIKKRYDIREIYVPYGVSKALNRLKPDVVVAMEYNPTVIMAMRWCKRHNVPYISWSDGTRISEKNISKIQRKSREYIVGRADAFIGSSTSAMENQIYLGADKSKCFISSLTVDISKYIRNKTEYGNRQIVCVGGLIVRKGVDLLLNALANTDPSITLLIVGDGGEKNMLMQQVENLDLQDRVTFAGFLDGEELTKAYTESDAFVIPTREDCFGLVILEAMCSKLPVIASKYADGAKDLVVDGKSGVIVDPYDSLTFAKAIEEVVLDKEKLISMGNAGFDRIKDFSFANVSKGYIEAIDSVIGE